MMPPREPRSVGPLGSNAPVGNEAKPTASTESHEPYTSIEEGQSPEDPGEPWTTVRCRWARSLELANFEPVTKKGYVEVNKIKGLTMDQVQTVRAAAETLTKSQKEVIEKRKRITHQRKSSSSSRGKGTSKAKGKGTDPLEWGNVNISQESLDIVAQAATFRSIVQEKQTVEWPRAVVGKETHQAAHRYLRSPHARLPAASQPVAQLGQDSYLGRALREVGRLSSRKESRRNKKSTPPSSQPSSSDEESSGSESSSSADEAPQKRRSDRHGRN